VTRTRVAGLLEWALGEGAVMTPGVDSAVGQRSERRFTGQA
jgi:hypothetical protein